MVGGVYNFGAGSDARIENSTISANSAINNGGGIFNDNAIFHLDNSIIANSLGNDCFSNNGPPSTNNYTLIEDNSCSPTLSGDPLLGSLTDNGGDTLTMALLSGSPAIDAGDPVFNPPPAYDQRGTGFPRVVNGRIDIGAYEVGEYALTVNKIGTGSGHVSSIPTGINCGLTCTTDFAENTVVTLTAIANIHSMFSGWSGACSGVGNCIVTMTGTKLVTATFTLDQHSLIVNKDGNGSGTIGSQPTGIDCGGTCSADFDYGTVVTLTAVANTGSIFTGWNGNCSGTGDCIVIITETKSVTATFTLVQYSLTVNKDGNGSGTISSQPFGIDCGSTCTADFNYGTVVTLTAVADTGSTFTNWGGACSGTGDCVVTMTQARSVTATFILEQYSLTVDKDGNGSGTVSSQPTGIDCGSTCTADFNYGTVVTLTAVADTGSTFTDWSGACSGTGDCVVTMTEARSVSATFTLEQYSLIVDKDGNGSGIISSQPTGINCGSSCTADFDYGTVVTLTAVADTGSTFTGWSGACTGTGACIVMMTETRSVTATFAAGYMLTVAKNGNGSGIITSQPTGIDCGDTCSAIFDSGLMVTLTVTADTGSTFTNWSGACSGTSDCVVTMTEAISVTATFTLDQHTLTINKDGTGSGTISSQPPGIDCGDSCTEDFDYGTVVTLTAVAGPVSTFTNWGGACSGTGDCVVAMTQAHSVTATFTLAGYQLFLPVVIRPNG